ncbi:GNAT family N-acetyltransferase [Peribacillus sp. NPDC097675]|uniref:GNAT family N-acetyltransferase n=1 Tax=Peribacillus sp. NPDC097675 TaxID=3390618 RepID=UPI003CFCE8C8
MSTFEDEYFVYKKVRTSEEFETFHQIKNTAWDEMGFEIEAAKEGSDLFLMIADDGLPGGTYEFIPYGMDTAPLIKKLFEDVITDDMKVMELDSLAVLPPYRGRLGKHVFCAIIDYAEKHNVTHLVALTDPKVFRSLSHSYHIPTLQVAGEIFYKGAYTIPTVFNLKEVYDNKHLQKYEWLSPVMEAKEGVLNAR